VMPVSSSSERSDFEDTMTDVMYRIEGILNEVLLGAKLTERSLHEMVEHFRLDALHQHFTNFFFVILLA
jgi:hypothetical protein